MIHRSPMLRIAAILMCVAIPCSAFGGNAVGKPSGSSSTIDWPSPGGPHESVELVVSFPNGDSITKTFKGNKPITLRLSDLGASLEDGTYNWEIRVSPAVSSDVARKLQNARAANDDSAARKIMREAGLTDNVSSGTFAISGGTFFTPSSTEARGETASSSQKEGDTIVGGLTVPTPRGGKVAVNDQVIPDDLIVQGSTCVGFDCVNNESFGFDTIKLKENSTRIKFEDTSTGSFPSNDWQLTANDSPGGTANRFSIEDITGSKVPFTVTAGAATNSIFVDSTGRVGFRTSTPVLDLHVTTSNTPALRLEQTNAGGFTAQTWDVAGNEANFFVRDVTSGSRLPFRIRPGAPTSSVDISASGEVGIGTASPESNLHVFSSATSDGVIGMGPDPLNNNSTPESAFNIAYGGASFGRGVGFMNVRPDASAVAPNPSIRLMTGNTVRVLIDNEGFIALGSLASTGGNPTSPIHYTNGANTALLTTAGVWQDASSREAKENINELSSETALQALRDLTPVSYNYKVVPDDPKLGFIAEDVPEIVATPDRKGLSALDIVAVVTKVVQEQQKTIDQLNQRIAELEAKQQ